MKPTELQNGLNALGAMPNLKVDGDIGRNTRRAIDAILTLDAYAGSRFKKWTDERRIVAAEQIIMARVGIEVGDADGLIGPQTMYARDVWESRKTGGNAETWRDEDVKANPPKQEAATPATAWPRQAKVPEFFGGPGTNLTRLEFPYPMIVAWDRSATVTHTQCNRKVVEPMRRIFERTLSHYGKDGIDDLRLNLFGGLFNKRRIRGGSGWSMHAYGIAIDIDPERNQLKWGRNLASLDDPAYEPFWGFVESEGALSLGRARNYDWMHFQFARL